MAKFKKLSEDELAAMRSPLSGQRAMIRDEYKSYLKNLKTGEGGQLHIEEDEKKVTIKNRLKRAAEELDITLEFKRTGAEMVRFQVVQGGKS